MSPTSITVAVTGATGLIGTALVAQLRARGHTVRRLVRTASAGCPDDRLWDPSAATLDPQVLDGCEAIVHLAGAPIARRWTGARKREILESRVRGTALLANAVRAMSARPRVVLSGSAIGYYGNRGDELLDERSAPGNDFLSSVVQEWERAAAPIMDAGVRLAFLRTGIVLSPHGGALEKLLLPFKLALGGPMGSGRQWMSWISLHDHIRGIEHAIHADGLHGPVNLVATNPVTNATFARTLGRVLARPAVLPLPASVLELLLGEMADATILGGQRVSPTVLQATGFQFDHPTLEGALRAELAG